MFLTCAGQVACHAVDAVGQVLPSATHAAHIRLTTQLAFGTDLASYSSHLGGEGIQLVHHRVDGVLELENFPFDVDRDLLGEVAVGDGGGDLGDVPDLRGEIAGHAVDVVRQVLPGPAHALHPGLPAELALGADFASHAGDLGGKRAELVHHRVHRLADPEELAHERPAFDVEGHRLRQVSPGHCSDNAGHFAGGLNQIADQCVDRVDRGRPGSGRPVQVRPLGDLPFLADCLAHPLEFAGGFPVEIDDVVQGVGDFSRDTHLRDRHLEREVTLANRGEHRKEVIGIQNIGTGLDRRAAVRPALGLPSVAGRATVYGRLFSRHGNS